MRSGTYQVQIPHVLAPAVRAEPARLRQAGFERKGIPTRRIEVVLEVFGRKRVHDLQVLPQTSEAPLLNLVEDAVGEAGANPGPVDSGLGIWNWYDHMQAFTPVGSHRRV